MGISVHSMPISRGVGEFDPDLPGHYHGYERVGRRVDVRFTTKRITLLWSRWQFVVTRGERVVFGVALRGDILGKRIVTAKDGLCG